MKKLLFSPGYGAGWTTWNDDDVAKIMVSYQPIIDFLEAGNKFTYADTERSSFHPLLKQLEDDVRAQLGDKHICILGADDLQVLTISDDTQVRFNEYDGYESVVYSDAEYGWY